MKPDFWSDETIAALTPACRLFYIGLWNIADDAGWLEWRPPRIGAVLFPYEGAAERVAYIESWALELVQAGRLELFECGCACVPSLPRHQRIAGKQSFVWLEKHRAHLAPDSGKGLSAASASTGNGNGRERNGTARPLSVAELAAMRDAEDAVDRAKLAASRRLEGRS